jgi:hypothetical protein
MQKDIKIPGRKPPQDVGICERLRILCTVPVARLTHRNFSIVMKTRHNPCIVNTMILMKDSSSGEQV